MQLKIDAELSYSLADACNLLLQIEVAGSCQQHLDESELIVLSGKEKSRVSGEESIGERVWIGAEERFACRYSALVSLNRPRVELDSLQQSDLSTIAGDEIKYLMSSRYCFTENFFDFTASEFRGLSGGALIVAMRDWIAQNMTYDIGGSNGQTGASESFSLRKGVCRDYAHVLIAMARSVAIPARFVSAYAPYVSPQDFHAVAEVYLDGAWHLVDPTGMSEACETAVIGVGRDASDVSFLTTYGFATFERQSVNAVRVP